MQQPEVGMVAVLNVGAGDLKLSFDPEKPVERDHARDVIVDMLARGYAILVQVGEKDGEPIYQRAKGFDPETREYLIVGAPEAAEVEAEEEAPPLKRKRGRPRGTTTRIPAEKARAVAVGRTAGG